jgi:phage terminase large subunit
VSQATCCWCRSPLVQAEGAYWCSQRPCQARQAAWAIEQTDKKGNRTLLYVPTPRQVDFYETTRKVRRVLYGGQAGPGKSHALRWGLYRDCLTIPNLNCLLLRRTYQQLEQTHLTEMLREQHLIGGSYTTGDKVMRFQNGSLIRAGHCENAADAMNYLSTEYDRIAFDELVTFDQGPALEIMSRARTSKEQVKASGDAQVWCGTNPGGRGSMWVREFFIDHAVDTSQFPRYEPGRYAFVEATLDDNPYISSEYRRDLEDLPEMRKRQLLYGDWFAFDGQFFSEFKPDSHVEELPLAPGLEWFCSMDMGWNSPGCVLWWACLPDGHYHIARDFKFRGLNAYEVAGAIKRITNELGIAKLRYVACDPAMDQKTGAGRGETIMETLRRRGLPMRKSDNDRFNGWIRCHELLRENQQSGRPWVTISPKAAYLLRTLPAMVGDDKDPDDLDTTQDDHAVDAFRYGAMSRPSPTRIVKDESYPVGSHGWWNQHYYPEPRKGVLA